MLKMKVQQSVLKNVFNELAKFRGKENMQHIHLKVNETLLSFHATDGEVVFLTRIPLTDGDKVNAEVKEIGELLLPPKFEEVIRKLPAGVIEITQAENNQIDLKSGKTKVKVNGVETVLPAVPVDEQGEGIALNTKVLSALVNATAFAASDKDTRPVLKAIHMTSDENSFRVLSTDSHRLSQKLIPKNLGLPTLNIPAKRLLDVVGVLNEDESLQLIPAGNHVLIKTEYRDIYIRQLEGTFPDVSRLIESNPLLKIKVDRKQIIESIDRALTFAKEGQHRGISLESGEGQLCISSFSESTGNIQEDIVAEIDGDNQSITVNAKFALEALKAFTSTTVTFHVQNAAKPIFIFSDEDTSLTQLILPIRTA